MMLEKANTAYVEALKKLDKIREKQKKIGTTSQTFHIFKKF